MTSDTATSEVILTEDVGRVRIVTMNRPETLNAFNLELLAALRLAPAECAQIAVLALGPVARRGELRFALTVAQGQRDWISRLGWPGPVHHRTPGDHLGYLACPATTELARDWVRAHT